MACTDLDDLDALALGAALVTGGLCHVGEVGWVDAWALHRPIVASTVRHPVEVVTRLVGHGLVEPVVYVRNRVKRVRITDRGLDALAAYRAAQAGEGPDHA